jgi:hypothetical protein
MNGKAMPEWVAPTRDLISRTFGSLSAVSELDYRTLLCIFRSHFSDRGLAEAMVWTLGKNYLEALHDVYSMQCERPSIVEENLAPVREKLIQNGLEEWLRDHPALE